MYKHPTVLTNYNKKQKVAWSWNLVLNSSIRRDFDIQNFSTWELPLQLLSQNSSIKGTWQGSKYSANAAYCFILSSNYCCLIPLHFSTKWEFGIRIHSTLLRCRKEKRLIYTEAYLATLSNIRGETSCDNR